MYLVPITTSVASWNPTQAIQHYVIKFVSNLRQVGTPVFSTNRTDRHDTTEILLKVTLNTINQPGHQIKIALSQNNQNYNLYFSLPRLDTEDDRK